MFQFRERLSERAWIPQWLRHQHFGRYQWVSERLRGKRVIDAACGTGYGSFALAKAGAGEVIGFDVAAEAVEEASSTYPAPNLKFVVADIRDLPIAPASVDAFVSFETVEHIERPGEYLREVARVLKKGGEFYCSTPNRTLTSPGLRLVDRPLNPHHFREYTAEEFREELSAHFAETKIWCQSLYSATYSGILGRLGRKSNLLAVRAHQLRKLCGIPWESPMRHHPIPYLPDLQPEVLIAVCRT